MNVVVDSTKEEAARETPRAAWTESRRQWAPALLPAAIGVVALIAPAYVFQVAPAAFGNGLGPAAWPRGVLALLAFFAFAWAARDVWAVAARGRPASLVAAREEGTYDWGKALIGLALIVAYGILLPKIGFALATAAFMTVWCLIGGIRNLLAITSVALIGTAILLWVFMGLALMPLSRGQGAFNDFSIALLRLLGIY
jgi:putative tricarboxylic transport membrane protein